MTTVFSTRSTHDLSVVFFVNGCKRKVKFTTPVLFGFVSHSTFTTNDDALAEAMKKSPMFGMYYYLESETGDKNIEKKEIPAPKPIEDELKDPSTAVYDETVTTKGMAVAYIQGNYDDVFTASTVEEMKREAARKWNVIFKNWGK